MKLNRWIGVLFVAIIWVPALMAQTAGTGGLTGLLKDPSGAVIPNATVTLTSAGTGQSRETKTGSDGIYKFTLLPPGDYRVAFAADGFKPITIPSVTITVTETATLDRTLEVGSTAQTVTVQSEVQTVQAESSTMGTVVNSATVVAMPLTTRNYTNLLAMSAGASSGVVNSATLGKASAPIAVNGADIGQNTYLQDGVVVSNWLSVNSNQESTAIAAFPVPNPDTIQEFKIQTSTYDASYGRNPGANVDIVTKSGTNDFHGTAFEFFRNTALDANDYFRNATVGTPGNNGSKQTLDQNQYGGVFGGPLKKDKLFFFGSYQGTNERNAIAGWGYSTDTLAPIPNLPRGNCPLSATSVAGCDATAQAFASALGAAVCPANNPGNAFDSIKTAGSITVACDGSNINPIALRVLQLPYAGGYLIPGSGTSNYSLASFTDPATYWNHQGMGNWDYIVNSKNTLSGRYYYEGDADNGPFAASGTSTTASNILPGAPVSKEITNQTALLRLTTVLSNNAVNEVRVSWQRATVASQELTNFTNSQVGIPDITPGVDYLDDFTISGLFTVGTNSGFLVNTRANQVEWADQFSWTHGKHSFRTGFEAESIQANEILNSAIGSVTFKSFPDFLIGRAACPVGVAGCSAANPGTSNGSAQSNISNFSGTANGGDQFNGRALDLDAFIQDDIKVNSRLTVNAGLRWEYDGYPTEKYGDFTNIWPTLLNQQPIPGSGCVTSTGPIGLGASGTGCSLVGFMVPSNFQGTVPTGVYQNVLPYDFPKGAPLHDFAPRLGFAWQPTSSNRLVVRGGGGIFYDLVNGVAMMQFPMRVTPGIATIVPVSTDSLAQPFALPAVIPGPAGTYGFTPRWINLANGQNSNIGQITNAENFTVPVSYEWNLNTQYEFVHNWVLELGYVGSHGIHQELAGGGGSPGGGTGAPWNWATLASPSAPAITGVTTNTVANVPLRVQYLGISPLASQYVTNSSYIYNALEATVRTAAYHGLQFQAAYTFNRAFTSTPFGINTAPYEIMQMAPSTLYHPQRLVINYTYNLPLGHWSGFRERLAEGWTLSGVTTIQDGTPLTLIDSSGGTVFYGTTAPGYAPPQFCPGMTISNAATSGSIESRLNNYFNKGTFCSVPVLGSDGVATGYGNDGQGNIMAPGQSNWDISIGKITKVGGIRENGSLLFRAEFFNALNHPMFNVPEVLNGSTNSSLDRNSANFGLITTTAVNPRLIQLVLKYSF